MFFYRNLSGREKNADIEYMRATVNHILSMFGIDTDLRVEFGTTHPFPVVDALSMFSEGATNYDHHGIIDRVVFDPGPSIEWQKHVMMHEAAHVVHLGLRPGMDALMANMLDCRGHGVAYYRTLKDVMDACTVDDEWAERYWRYEYLYQPKSAPVVGGVSFGLTSHDAFMMRSFEHERYVKYVMTGETK